ncbi:hypothetical protein ACP70R_022516 [Stipagrostis hirtigluma subsp. patula]
MHMEVVRGAMEGGGRKDVGDGAAPGAFPSRGAGGARGSRATAAGRGGGRSGSWASGGRGHYDQFAGGAGFNDQGFGDGGFFNGPGFNPNFGPYPPNFGPGWGWPNPMWNNGRGRFHGRGRQSGGRSWNRGGAGPLLQDRNAASSVDGRHTQQRPHADKTVPQLKNTAPSSSGTKDDAVAPLTNPGIAEINVGKVVKDLVEAVDTMGNSQGLDLGTVDASMKHRNCYRCGSKGHAVNQCTVELLCDLCEGTDHVEYRCPLQSESKPVAQSVGFALDTLGAYYIEHPPIQPTVKNTRTALVTVEGGALSQEELIGHLKLLVRQNFEWEVEVFADNKYKVLFPTRTELLRYTYLEIAKLPNGVSLKFQEFKEEEEYFGHLMPTVWMKVLNLPAILRKFKILWAIGTMFGVTQKVDMKTTRANKFGRFCVAVLEPEIVPDKMDVIIGNRFFQLKFQIEPFTPNTGLLYLRENGGKEDDSARGGCHDYDMELDEAHGQGSEGQGAGDVAKGKAKKFPENVDSMDGMEHDWEEYDLLQEDEDEMDEVAMKRFVGLKPTDSINVIKASSLSSSNITNPSCVYVPQATAGITSHSSVISKPHVEIKAKRVEKSGLGASVVAPPMPRSSGRSDQRVSLVAKSQDQVAPAALVNARPAVDHDLVAATALPTGRTSGRQDQGVKNAEKLAPAVELPPPITTAAVGGGAHPDTSSLGGLLDSLLSAGVSADGSCDSELGSANVVAMLATGSSSPMVLRSSKRSAETMDMDSMVKAQKRAAQRNLDDVPGNLQGNLLDQVLVAEIEGGGSCFYEAGVQSP